MLESLAQTRGAEPKELADELGRLGRKERYNGLAGDVLRQVQNDPAGTFRRRLEAGLNFLFGKEWFQRGVLWKSTESEETQMPGWLAASYPALLYGILLGMLALGLLGWRWTFGCALGSDALFPGVGLGPSAVCAEPCRGAARAAVAVGRRPALLYGIRPRLRDPAARDEPLGRTQANCLAAVRRTSRSSANRRKPEIHIISGE